MIRGGDIRIHISAILVIVAASWSESTVPAPSLDQGTTVETLLQELTKPDQAEGAATQLLEVGESDAEGRKIIANRLPGIIGRNDLPRAAWLQAVAVAGGLKIAEAAPDLAKSIDVDTGPDLLTSSSVAHLRNNAAAAALAQIGDPAIPSVRDVLRHGTEKQRVLAVYVLRRIGSPQAKSALEEALHNETDPKWQSFFQRNIAAIAEEEKKSPQ